jgi:hypothetical protein
MLTLHHANDTIKIGTIKINVIKDEARHLVENGTLNCQQPILSLCGFFPERERYQVEKELELNQYLLRDRISDLVNDPSWAND